MSCQRGLRQKTSLTPLTSRRKSEKRQVLLCDGVFLDGRQRIINPDKVVLAVVLQDQLLEVQSHAVGGVRSQAPLQEDVGRVRRIGETRRANDSALSDMHVKGLLNWKTANYSLVIDTRSVVLKVGWIEPQGFGESVSEVRRGHGG